MKKLIKIGFISVIIIAALGVYLYATIKQLNRVNLDITRTDQDAYIHFTKDMRESNYTYLGDRNRMPVYPFIQSLFYRKSMGEQTFFRQGKYINICLSILMLAFLFFIFKKIFVDWLFTINLTLVTAFSVFMFRAAYFQCELLFYFLNFLSFLLMCKMLIKPEWKWGILTGAVLGITHLTKASVLPGILLWVFFSIVSLIYLVNKVIFAKGDADYTREYKNKSLSRLFCVICLALGFIITIYPYLADTKKKFGSYFYNVNTKFYLWYDSWEEAKSGTQGHGDEQGWPDMPPELIPSPSKYLREHSMQQIIRREVEGFYELVMNLHNPDGYGYSKYCYIYSFAFFLFLALAFEKIQIKTIAKYSIPALFCLAYFILYILLYAWYAPIASGDRFILSLFLPLMFILSFVITKSSKSIYFSGMPYRENILHLFNILILYIFASDLFSLVQKALYAYTGD